MDLYLKNTYSEGKPIKIEYCVAPYGVLQKKDAKVFYRNPDGTYTPEPASEDSKKVYKIPIYMPGQSGFPYSAVPIYDDYKCGIGYLSCRNLMFWDNVDDLEKCDLIITTQETLHFIDGKHWPIDVIVESYIHNMTPCKK